MSDISQLNISRLNISHQSAQHQSAQHQSDYTDSVLGCIFQKNLRQSRQYYQSRGMIFEEQNLYKIINLPNLF